MIYCIFNWCKAAGIDPGLQMGTIYAGLGTIAQRNTAKCPQCRQPLLNDDGTAIGTCNDLLEKKKLTLTEIKELSQLSGGFKVRKLRKFKSKKNNKKSKKNNKKSKKHNKKSKKHNKKSKKHNKKSRKSNK